MRRPTYAVYAVWGRVSAFLECKKNHVRQDNHCRLHGLEQRHPPPAQGGERVSRTTENLVKIQCDGVAVGDTVTWHRLIENLTWLRLGRNYTSAEGAIPLPTRFQDFPFGEFALLKILAVARDIWKNGPAGLARLGRLPCPEGDRLPLRQGSSRMASIGNTERHGRMGISNFSATGLGGDPNDPSSPSKRQCTGGETLTLQMLQETLRRELSKERAELRKEINGALQGVSSRVDAMEKGLEYHGSRTLQAVETLTSVQAEQSAKIQAVAEDTAQLGLRMTALEGKIRDLQSVGSTNPTQDRGRTPALITGGWPAETLLEKANAMARDLIKLQLNMQEAFVPGVRREFVLIPMKPNQDESDAEMRQRAQACIKRVNQAGVHLGTKADGNAAKLWLAVSQPLEKGRRAALAGKIKRLISVGPPPSAASSPSGQPAPCGLMVTGLASRSGKSLGATSCGASLRRPDLAGASLVERPRIVGAGFMRLSMTTATPFLPYLA